MSKSSRLRRAGHVARMEEGRSAFEILTYTPTGTKNLKIKIYKTIISPVVLMVVKHGLLH